MTHTRNDSGQDEYDIFLDNWQPSQLSDFVSLESNLFDPLAQQELLNDITADGTVQRTLKVNGTRNNMSAEETDIRKLDFFEEQQPLWSDEFRTRLIDEGLQATAVDRYIKTFNCIWTHSKSRQTHPDVLAIKAAISCHDRFYTPHTAGAFVKSAVPASTAALFHPQEMAIVFSVNMKMIEVAMADYLNALYGPNEGSINSVYVRRGVCMPGKPGPHREELHYLSSFSLARTPIEQFAQQRTRNTANSGVVCVFSAPIPAIQDRIAAFAPFIHAMDLSQLELVVAPPTSKTPLLDDGEHGTMLEYRFR
jgi:hypothetical protein